MPNGKKKKRHKMSTHKRKKDCARIVIRASKGSTALSKSLF